MKKGDNFLRAWALSFRAFSTSAEKTACLVCGRLFDARRGGCTWCGLYPSPRDAKAIYYSENPRSSQAVTDRVAVRPVVACGFPGVRIPRLRRATRVSASAASIVADANFSNWISWQRKGCGELIRKRYLPLHGQARRSQRK